MVKKAHNVIMSVFCEPEEQEQLKELITSMFLTPMFKLDLEKEKLSFKIEKVTGMQDNKIIILRLTLIKDRQINLFLDILKENLGEEQCSLLSKQAESRIDYACDFFLRLDKDQLKKEKYILTDKGNCIHFKINPAVFPKNRQNAILWVNETFK